MITYLPSSPFPHFCRPGIICYWVVLNLLHHGMAEWAASQVWDCWSRTWFDTLYIHMTNPSAPNPAPHVSTQSGPRNDSHSLYLNCELVQWNLPRFDVNGSDDHCCPFTLVL
ncbi:hypothetical protein Pmani_028789 [Petrolisthes manimaculis]|uniref:Uncharacterized protein n=1 Tax=Petrolisthes manimaculis TaxID=1843537 RepID=A0AAE1P0X1_9EUCA|nr:hypothetical protein Pmani_028789 [Petrolisthes manimaculis]